MNAQVLLIVTSHSKLGGSGRDTGVWLEELAQAYYEFETHGFDVAIASTRGGPAPIDPASSADPWLSPTGMRLLEDPLARGKIERTERLESVAAQRLAAAYIVGGAGVMWDLPDCRALGELLSTLYEAGRPLAAVCHGVAGLAAARLPDGSPLVRGRQVTAFSNEEEEQVGYVPFLPVLPENLLRSQGAQYSSTTPWLEHVVTDGLLMTGQNPASAAPLARAVARLLQSAR